MAGVYAITVADFGGEVAWIAPTYKNSRPLWRMAEKLTQPVIKQLDVSRAERTIGFPSGGMLAVFSADNPVAILGNSFDVVVIDEAARVAEDTWTETIMPTLADRAGHAVLISTPKGKNWFWREWQRGKLGEPGYASFTAPSSDNPNPNIRKAALMAKERVSETTYRQEWLAEFVEDGAGVFRRVRQAATATPQASRHHAHTYVFGVDWARSNDYTVISVIDATAGELCYLDRFTQIDYEVQLMRLKALAQAFEPSVIWAESNSMGGPLVERLQAEGLPVVQFNTTNATKNVAITALALAFERGDLRILNDEVLINELEGYEQEVLPMSGSVRYGAPEGQHDDCVMSLAIAWQGIAGATWGTV